VARQGLARVTPGRRRGDTAWTDDDHLGSIRLIADAASVQRLPHWALEQGGLNDRIQLD